MSDIHSSTPAPSGKPASPAKPSKPYPDFPLTPHPSRRWCKKIRGRLHYFGRWEDGWEAALDNYLKQKDALHAGRKPRVDPDGVTVKDCANAFLNHKRALLDAGELSPHTWLKYRQVADLVVGHFGKNRIAADLGQDDFASLRRKMASKWGILRLRDMVGHVRSIFKHAHEAELLAVPIVFGPGFARPSKKTQRLHRAEQGPRMFSASEIRRLVDAASPVMRAMILLAINGGMGNTDCARLPASAVDLDGGWIDYPRPKTGVRRKIPLWPETIDALRDVLAGRQDGGELVFVTRRGNSWTRDGEGGPITKEFKKLMKRLGINGHRGFYTLRHTFRTIADEARDQPAVDHVMGHESGHMSSVYRERISDERLRAVVEHVRGWLFPSTAFITAATPVAVCG